LAWIVGRYAPLTMADPLNQAAIWRTTTRSLVVHKSAAFVPQIATLNTFQRVAGRIVVVVTRLPSSRLYEIPIKGPVLPSRKNIRHVSNHSRSNKVKRVFARLMQIKNRHNARTYQWLRTIPPTA